MVSTMVHLPHGLPLPLPCSCTLLVVCTARIGRIAHCPHIAHITLIYAPAVIFAAVGCLCYPSRLAQSLGHAAGFTQHVDKLPAVPRLHPHFLRHLAEPCRVEVKQVGEIIVADVIEALSVPLESDPPEHRPHGVYAALNDGGEGASWHGSGRCCDRGQGGDGRRH